jgi:hypothetical protein
LAFSDKFPGAMGSALSMMNESPPGLATVQPLSAGASSIAFTRQK